MSGEVLLLTKKYDLFETIEIFVTSFKHVLSNLSEDNRDEVTGFLTRLIGEYNSHAMLSFDNLPSLQALVFESAGVRDFVLALKFVFFSRWLQGRGVVLLEALIDDLVIGVSFDSGLASHPNEIAATNIIPPQAVEAMSFYGDGKEVMRGNPWLVVMLLIQAYINLDDFETDKPKTGRNK